MCCDGGLDVIVGSYVSNCRGMNSSKSVQATGIRTAVNSLTSSSLLMPSP